VGYVLHVVPDSVGNAAKLFVGSTKDVRGRTEYFETRGIVTREHLSTARSDAELLVCLRSANLADCNAVLFEYETYVDSLRYLRDAHPCIRRIVRAHNANFPHYIDNFTGRVRMKNGARAAEDIRTAWQRFEQDRRCAEFADAMLAIANWEADAYWKPLAGAERVFVAPYFLPHAFELSAPAKKSGKLCVCFMGTGAQMTPLLYDAARNTIELVNRAGQALADWDFALTGSIKPKDALGDLGRVRATGPLPSPFPILQEARVVTVLSDLGMGFKTKILEAIVAGCWVLVTPDLYRRTPEAVRPWLKQTPTDSAEAFVAALRACEAAPPIGHPNDVLRAQAYAALDKALLPHVVGACGPVSA
jgi:hypothetical protein